MFGLDSTPAPLLTRVSNFPCPAEGTIQTVSFTENKTVNFVLDVKSKDYIVFLFLTVNKTFSSHSLRWFIQDVKHCLI